MTDHEDKVRAQWEKFQTELPSLLKLKDMPGKWIVYLNGLRHVAEGHDDAHAWALHRFGLDGGFVVAQVVPQEPIPAYKLGGLGAAAVYEKQYSELRAENERLHTRNRQLLEHERRTEETMRGFAAHGARVLKLIDAATRLVATLPKCSYCTNVATRAWVRGSARFCDGCAPTGCPEYPRAIPLRDTVVALKELERGQ